MISLWSPLHVSEVVKEAAEAVGRVELSPEFTVTCPVVGVGGSLVGCEGVLTGDDDALFISGDKVIFQRQNDIPMDSIFLMLLVQDEREACACCLLASLLGCSCESCWELGIFNLLLFRGQIEDKGLIMCARKSLFARRGTHIFEWILSTPVTRMYESN